MIRQDDTTFEQWIAVLEKDENVIRGYGVPLSKSTGLECWRGFWEDDYSPTEAIQEDMTNWE